MLKDETKATEEATTEEAPTDIRKLVSAFQTTFQHQNGRAPNEQEVAEFLHSQEQRDESAQEPAVLKTQVVESKSGEPLFYLQENRCFDVEQGQWLPKVPSFVAELPARPMTRDDMGDMIVHGVIDPDSFEMLKSSGLVSHSACRLYDRLNPKGDLSKSDDGEEDGFVDAADEFKDDGLDDDWSTEAEWPEDGDDSLITSPTEQYVAEPVVNFVEEMFRLVSEYKLDKRMEEAVRRIVREEMSGGRSAPASDPFTLTPDEQAQLPVEQA